MARSYRHTPIVGNAGARSEKRDKQLWHRKFRRVNRHRVEHEQEPLLEDETTEKAVWNKDGKQYLSAGYYGNHGIWARCMTYDEWDAERRERYAKLMRK